jgi:hypothetical protein
MKVRDLLNYLIEYEKEGFSLDDKVMVRMFMTHGKAGIRGDFIDFKDCAPGPDSNILRILINQDEGDYWEWEEEKKEKK